VSKEKFFDFEKLIPITRWLQMKRQMFMLIVITVILVCNSATADTYSRQIGVNVLNYSFYLQLNDHDNKIAGETVVDLQILKDGTAQLGLDLTSPSAGLGMSVLEVSSEGAPLPFRHQLDRLTFNLPPPFKACARRQFKIRYQGTPAAGLRIGANRRGERTFFSHNWPDKARQWLPTIDHPYDKATSEFIVDAPTRYQVVANGLIQEETDLGDGIRRTHWKQSQPIASWLNALGVAPFASHHAGSVRGIPLQTWVAPQDRNLGFQSFEPPMRQALEFYSERIGPYPYQKLGAVAAPGVNGGMEHASLVFYGEESVTGQPATDLVAHEVAHQWFGDSVTQVDWNDVWLSEGFATYFALLFTEHYIGREAFLAGLSRSRDIIFAYEASNPQATVVHRNLADMSQVIHPLIYNKGAWTLHMLRGIIGDSAFTEGIRDYYSAYRDANASTDDLRRVVERGSGKELAWFFDQWLNHPGSPTLAGAWWHDAPAKRLVVELTQIQPGDLYRLPLEIGILTAANTALSLVKVDMKTRQQRFEILCEHQPTSVVIDPNSWVLLRSTLERRR
jgi:aminopeptidase N